MLRQLDLCSGIGVGFPLAGLQLGGFKLIGFCEQDDYCRDILNLRYPDTEIYPDIRSLPVVEGIDCITASPPCPPFSIQGKRLGADDPRDCFPAVIRAIASIQPRFFAIENVHGLLSCPYKPGYTIRYFSWLTTELSLCGFDVEWLCVASGHFGSSFVRRRLLMVGVARSLKLDWERTTTWTEQVRGTITELGSDRPSRGCESDFSRGCFSDSTGMVRPIGTPSGNSTVRRQREALGNCLDPRVAKVALARILYLNSLLEK